MKNNKQDFVNFIFNKGIIKFGKFRLKSGRQSPYFFDFGSFNDSSKIISLGNFYANSIIENKLEFDVIFGPAYKGIPICLSTVIALSNNYDINVNFAFNRKEKKGHGEGGNIIGAPIKGKRVLAVDDVLTSGKTIKETKEIVEDQGGILTSFLVALDRKEKAVNSQLSALEQAAKTYNVNIYAVASISDVMEYIKETYGDSYPYFSLIKSYLQEYGCEDIKNIK
ncbi:orotate phosphoribosyltransferase [Anoxybacillus caldiproteolyticus]|nr:orotate phosphoribosyltransferase [Anoxybacillus caldiproteolyticus]